MSNKFHSNQDNMQYLISDGLQDYPESLNIMEKTVAGIISGTSDELVWLTEHPPLYTAGSSAAKHDLLEADKFPVYQTGRGGQYTYHGPGQRVVYVMLDLKKRQATDIKAYIFDLEQWIINTLNFFGVDGQRRQGRVGIWVENEGTEEKIAAIGIRVRKWVTYHGIAININPDLSHFEGIVPCGISQYGVTSLEKLGINVPKEKVDEVLKREFENIFMPIRK
ncbi:MAG: lipoyl(octanoyl) transferase LipB [Rickettsiales bacterium]|nr:lipoyl(octanoyl) transferase LipB [Rickettsiales bacterium]MDG4545207.1 lipoyl(octanoyl) transferase LipB [Rickettsiales bacterium]MDG4547330.1 lipoyl(octanoyl) transferase LipB [Rickettsiales bacterium]